MKPFFQSNIDSIFRYDKKNTLILFTASVFHFFKVQELGGWTKNVVTIGYEE